MQNDFERTGQNYEWILTNGLGGYALGFGNFVNARKYNGLLISSDQNFKRTHILSSMEELVEWRGNEFYLDSNYYNNCIYPNGIEHILKYWNQPYPAAVYSSVPFSEHFIIAKEVMMPKGKNAVIIKYSHYGTHPVNLMLRPKLSFRDHHQLASAGIWDYTPKELQINGTDFYFKRADVAVPIYGYIAHGEIEENYQLFKGVFYPIEAYRGYDSIEDLLSPVLLQIKLKPNTAVFVVFSTEELDQPMKLAAKTEKEYLKLPIPADHIRRKSKVDTVYIHHLFNFDDLFIESDFLKLIKLAAGNFIARHDLIAGYPWFGAWGRDTMIALHSLRLLDNGRELISMILKKYGQHIKNGLIPNTFGEGHEGLNYDTVDAPLWFGLRVYQYFTEYKCYDEKLFACVINILLNFINNKRMPFILDEDGLVNILDGQAALTWMDAKVYGVPVTPRFGKPIEINALWYNLLCAVQKIAAKNRLKIVTYKTWELPVKELDNLIAKVKQSLQKFFEQDFPVDRIENGFPINEVRPNAIIALSLPFEIIDQSALPAIYARAKNELFTPFGLRSLSILDSGFKKKYLGNHKQRDLAYHQGTVWTFLQWPLAQLATKVFTYENKLSGLADELEMMIRRFKDGFLKGYMGSVAEIWDGENPQQPKGCPAQAWSVFALLEIETMIRKLNRGGKQ
jgi:predicted glycogen debranching enzyme